MPSLLGWFHVCGGWGARPGQVPTCYSRTWNVEAAVLAAGLLRVCEADHLPSCPATCPVLVIILSVLRALLVADDRKQLWSTKPSPGKG